MPGMSASTFGDSVINLFLDLHSFDRIPRAGFLLRGVTETESLAAHSHALALLVCVVAPKCSPPVNVLEAARMALIHDLPEAKTMDIPMPVGGAAFRKAKTEEEIVIFEEIFSGQDGEWKDLFLKFQEGSCAEAALVRGLDKVQMMIKVLGYEREGRGRLEDFWLNKDNFRDYGIPIVKELFDDIFRTAGRKRPLG
jgi:putative hydrolase of HD superfamily